MEHLTKIKLDKNYIETIIPQTKTLKEMADLCDCSSDKLRKYMKTHGLYKYYCEQHHIKYNEQNDNLICEICGDKTDVQRFHGIPYCKRHFLQMYRHGKIMSSTIYDRNEIIIKDDIAEVVMRDVKQNIKAIAIIDAEDVDKIKDYKWYESAGYCITKAFDPYSGTDIANVIFNNFKNRYDHISHNRLDNRKINLRPVTQQQNAMNMGMKNTNTSGVTGVAKQCIKKRWNGRWQANLTYQYKTKWLGSYENFNDAVKARLQGEIKYFGEYSPNYDPETKTIRLTYIDPDNITHFVEYNLEGELLHDNQNAA